jgi:hypothetical protein
MVAGARYRHYLPLSRACEPPARWPVATDLDPVPSPRGDQLTPDNLEPAERGTRWRCRQCGAERAAAWRRRRVQIQKAVKALYVTNTGLLVGFTSVTESTSALTLAHG